MVITGIKVGVAKVLVGHSADLKDVTTGRNLQDDIEFAESLTRGAARDCRP